MPKLKRHEYDELELDENLLLPDDNLSLSPSEYEHLVSMLHYEFGIPHSMIEYHPCAGDDSLFIRFNGESIWLFEIEEFTYYNINEWNLHVLNRLNSAYEEMEKYMNK